MKKNIKPGTYACPAPVWCVGTYDAAGKANVMTVIRASICCSTPPHLAISVKKSAYSYQALLQRQCYTVSIPSVKYLKEVDYFGIVSGRNVDKFETSGLTATHSEQVDAPYVAEFPLIFACKVRHVVDIGGHVQFVGEILGIKADKAIVNDNGLPDITKIAPLIYAPASKEYWSIKSNE